jgi:hypothetical protein
MLNFSLFGAGGHFSAPVGKPLVEGDRRFSAHPYLPTPRSLWLPAF